MLDEVILSEVAEDENVDISDRVEIAKILKTRVNQFSVIKFGIIQRCSQVNELIDKANALWDERNARAVEEGESELPQMLPIIRLKVVCHISYNEISSTSPIVSQVDTTGVSEMSNPVRFGQEFQGRIANPRDVLVFHRARKTADRGSKVTVEQPELSIDDPELSVAEKLSKVRVHTLVREYLAAQELQLLGEVGMSDAIEIFVDKDDIHAIQKRVHSIRISGAHS